MKRLLYITNIAFFACSMLLAIFLLTFICFSQGAQSSFVSLLSFVASKILFLDWIFGYFAFGVIGIILLAVWFGAFVSKALSKKDILINICLSAGTIALAVCRLGYLGSQSLF